MGPFLLQESTMQLSKLTYALVAAGLIGGVATFYNQLEGVSPALAAAPAVSQPAVIPTAAANLPDFTALVDRAGPAVVNISVTTSAKNAMMQQDDNDDEDDNS